LEACALIVLVTAGNEEEAEKIGEKLLSEKLAACVNIVKDVKSLFWWQGKIDRAQESLMVIKTQPGLFRQLAAVVREIHSYDVPEIIALPVIAGDKDYLEWLNSSVKGPEKD